MDLYRFEIEGTIERANLIRRAIMLEVETYAIQYVLFHINESPRIDEIIALRLGQSVINNDSYNYEEGRKYRLDVTGPKVVTCSDIQGIEFSGVTPITELKGGQRLLLDVIVEKGKGSMHAKFRPVAQIFVEEDGGKVFINFKGIGMMKPEEILELGIRNIDKAAERKPKGMFFRQALE